jgi:hypothetical protein
VSVALPSPAALILKRFEKPDKVREMPLGRFELVRLGGMTLGRATYQPGWRWSEHVGRSLGQGRCQVEHVGVVLAGAATAAFTFVAPARRRSLRPLIALAVARPGANQ